MPCADHPSAPVPAVAWRLPACAVLAAALLAGCAGQRAYQEGQAHLARGEAVRGVDKLRQASAENPTSTEFRLAYYEQRAQALEAALRDLDLALEAGDFERAELARQRAEALDAAHPRVRAAPDRIAAQQRLARLLDRAEALARDGRPAEAVDAARQVISETPTHRRAQALLRQFQRQYAEVSGRELGLYPRLRDGFRKPVSLAFSNATLQQVLEALKHASGLNFVIDRDVKADQRVALSVSGKTVEEVLRMLMVANQLEQRVLDADTLLIYPATAQKMQDYQELVVRSFYLANADVHKAASLVSGIAKARDVFVDDKLNVLVVRDTREVIRLAERILANHDLADPEVVLELEVMEVSSNRLTELGIRWPDAIAAGVQGQGGVGTLTLPEFQARGSDLVRLRFNDPLVAAQLRGQKGDARLLANPRVRVRNRQTARILIGERVPVITTTATPNAGTFENVNYLDVGLKLELEPTVSLDDEVSMKIALEVSNIVETINRPTTQVYRLGTRNTSTQLRVRGGDTQILAGLIQRDERNASAGIPYLSEVPLLGRLFGAGSDNHSKTEIVLLITPRIVRNVDVPGPGQIELPAGPDRAQAGAALQNASGGSSVAVPRTPAAPAFSTPGLPPSYPPPSLSAPPLVPASPGAPMLPAMPAQPRSFP